MIELLLVLAIGGFIVWAVTTLIPMPAAWRTVLYGLAVILALVYVLSWFGVIDWWPRGRWAR